MQPRRIIVLAAIALIAFACGQKQPEKMSYTAQDRKFPELNAYMDALDNAVHGVIDSNLASVRENAPLLADACRTLEKAPLPKFFDDVAQKFTEIQPALTAAVDHFTDMATSGTDDQLKAALDSVRSVSVDVWAVFVPNIKPIEDFHKALQPAWHTYTINEEWDSLRNCLPAFDDAIRALDSTSLPAKYDYAQDKFKTGVVHLEAAFDSLKYAFAENRLDDLSDKMTDLHDAFHELQEFYK